MACTFYLRDTLLPGSVPGGIWTQVGFSTVASGPFVPGGSTIPIGGDNPLIDASTLITGFYLLSYDDYCNPAQEVILQVMERAEAGSGQTIHFCVNDTDIVNLFDHALFGDSGGTWSVNPGSDSIPGGAFDPGAGTFSIPGLGGLSGIFILNYAVQSTVESGYGQMSCASCNDITAVTIVVAPEFDAGEDNTIIIPQANGSFNLFDFLNGAPDVGGTWTQVSGTATVINNGYLGTVNLDKLDGCEFVFKYAGGNNACADEAFITVIRDPEFNLEITQSGNQLTANHTACGNASYQWFYDDGTGYVSTGLTTQTITATNSDGMYKVVLNCGGCIQEDEIRIQVNCDNNPCFTFNFNATTDCLTVIPNGTNNSPIATDTIQWKKDGGSYTNYTTPICGCDLREFLNIVPYCQVVGGKIRVGYSSISACPGRTVSQVLWEFGNGTGSSASGNLWGYWLEYTPAEWIAFQRTITFTVRVSTPIGNLLKKVKFTYSGSGAASCANITTTHENYPKLYYKIWAKRTVIYTDGCPTVVCENSYQVDNGCTVEVNISNCNVGGNASLCATVYNCSGTPTFQWKKDGAVLLGETAFYVPKTYGFGLYEVIVTCGDCIASDFAIYQPDCQASVSIAVAGNLMTANVAGCTGSVSYQWYFNNTLIVGANSSTYTATQSGTYKVIIQCSGCTAEASVPHTIPCTMNVTLGLAANVFTATTSSCAGSKTYTWDRWNGTTWVQVQQQTTASNTNTYTASQSGIYRVTVLCIANGCIDTEQMTYQVDCAIVVSISVTGTNANPIWTANVTGCSGIITYQWQRWNGTSWVNVATGQVYNPTVQGQHRVIVTCGECTQTAYITFTGCEASVNISVSGSVLTANVTGCVGGVTYLWELSINGGATWSTVGVAQSITATQSGIYRITITCSGCTATAQVTFTQPCSTTLSLSYNQGTNTITASTSGCSGAETIVWQFSASGSGWTTIASGVYSIMPTQTGWYRAITMCDGLCPLSRDIQVTLDDPCEGLAMIVNATPGLLSWDILKLNGVNVVNYLISWRRVSDNSEVFKSGAGSYFSPGTMYPHPKSNTPMATGQYYPYILNSDVGNNLNCLPVITVPAVLCSSNFKLSYDGSGGIAANHSVSIEVGPSTGNLKIGFQTLTVADKLQVKYNNVIIFDSGNISTGNKFKMFAVPIAYVSGQNAAEIIVTNSTPAQNTIFTLWLGCCANQTSCPVTLDLVGVIPTLNASCGCGFDFDYAYNNFQEIWDALCLDVNDYVTPRSFTQGGCGPATVLSDSTCVSCSTIAFYKTSGQAGFTMTFPPACAARYTTFKAQVTGTATNNYVVMNLKKVACGSDGITHSILFFPHKGTMAWDDGSRTLTYTMSATNPFPDNCTSCNRFLRTQYSSSFNQLNNSGSAWFTTAPYGSIVSLLQLTATTLTVTDSLFNDMINTECGLVERKYKITYRSNACPCQSWELYEDTDDNGSYETLRAQAPGWGGSCV